MGKQSDPCTTSIHMFIYVSDTASFFTMCCTFTGLVAIEDENVCRGGLHHVLLQEGQGTEEKPRLMRVVPRMCVEDRHCESVAPFLLQHA